MDLKDATILLIEDQACLLDMMASMLRQSGVRQVLRAQSVSQALSHTDETIDIIVTDLELGRVNGLELARAIRNGETCFPTDQKIIFMTSHCSGAVAKASFELGVSGFVCKPVRAGVMLAKITHALKRRVKLKAQSCYAKLASNPIPGHSFLEVYR